MLVSFALALALKPSSLPQPFIVEIGIPIDPDFASLGRPNEPLGLHDDDDLSAAHPQWAGLRDVYWSPDMGAAMAKPPVKVKSRDVVLFKASRGVRLERVYEAVKGSITRRRRAGGN